MKKLLLLLSLAALTTAFPGCGDKGEITTSQSAGGAGNSANRSSPDGGPSPTPQANP